MAGLGKRTALVDGAWLAATAQEFGQEGDIAVPTVTGLLMKPSLAGAVAG